MGAEDRHRPQQWVEGPHEVETLVQRPVEDAAQELADPEPGEDDDDLPPPHRRSQRVTAEEGGSCLEGRRDGAVDARLRRPRLLDGARHRVRAAAPANR